MHRWHVGENKSPKGGSDEVTRIELAIEFTSRICDDLKGRRLQSFEAFRRSVPCELPKKPDFTPEIDLVRTRSGTLICHELQQRSGLKVPLTVRWTDVMFERSIRILQIEGIYRLGILRAY